MCSSVASGPRRLGVGSLAGFVLLKQGDSLRSLLVRSIDPLTPDSSTSLQALPKDEN